MPVPARPDGSRVKPGNGGCPQQPHRFTLQTRCPPLVYKAKTAISRHTVHAAERQPTGDGSAT